ncbi:MAG: alpha/beta fold hydrolase [Steroidobacteraceae bacterium]
MRTSLLILLTVVAVYVLLVAYVFIFQARLIFFPNVPGRTLTATPRQIGLEFEDLRVTTADRVDLHGWYVAAAPGAPAVILCHGNAGNIAHRLEWLEMLCGMGFAMLLFDYRGFGRSRGTPTEQGTYLDAQAAWDYLTNTKGFSPRSIVIVGESLGGPIAAHLAKDVGPGALILVSTFTSVPDLASNLYWYLPVRLLARFQYPTAEYVARVHVPTLVIHSRDDEMIPFLHGEELRRRASGSAQLLEIFGDHNAAFMLSRPKLIEGIRSVLESNCILRVSGKHAR